MSNKEPFIFYNLSLADNGDVLLGAFTNDTTCDGSCSEQTTWAMRFDNIVQALQATGYSRTTKIEPHTKIVVKYNNIPIEPLVPNMEGGFKIFFSQAQSARLLVPVGNTYRYDLGKLRQGAHDSIVALQNMLVVYYHHPRKENAHRYMAWIPTKGTFMYIASGETEQFAFDVMKARLEKQRAKQPEVIHG